MRIVLAGIMAFGICTESSQANAQKLNVRLKSTSRVQKLEFLAGKKIAPIAQCDVVPCAVQVQSGTYKLRLINSTGNESSTSLRLQRSATVTVTEPNETLQDLGLGVAAIGTGLFIFGLYASGVLIGCSASDPTTCDELKRISPFAWGGGALLTAGGFTLFALNRHARVSVSLESVLRNSAGSFELATALPKLSLAIAF